ncbi:hypothetical protein [Massilia brevitalea]|uniref:hypothetical protein n=1 Tax=Massilia brevitalea TaxID=442526 RepID=UPI0027384FE2|nr:hypothetical protein [Massilia brevitalea]
MAEEALEIELRQETEFLAAYDRVVRAVNECFDVRGSDLATLVRCCLDNDNMLSKHHRKQYATRVPEAAMDLIESEARTARAELVPNDAPAPDDESLDDQAEGSRL